MESSPWKCSRKNLHVAFSAKSTEKMVFGQRLDSIVLEALSTLTDSVTL